MDRAKVLLPGLKVVRRGWLATSLALGLAASLVAATAPMLAQTELPSVHTDFAAQELIAVPGGETPYAGTKVSVTIAGQYPSRGTRGGPSPAPPQPSSVTATCPA